MSPAPIVLCVSDTELATILASLRGHQENLVRATNDPEGQRAAARRMYPDHFASHVPLNEAEIDGLCERLNG